MQGYQCNCQEENPCQVSTHLAWPEVSPDRRPGADVHSRKEAAQGAIRSNDLRRSPVD
jgi:hypothetical protein